MKKISFYYILLFIVICSCEGGVPRQLKSQLIAVDSLLNQEQNDSAYTLLNCVRIESLNAEELAYYNLLLTQASWVLYKPDTPDSLLDYTIRYYIANNDEYKLATAYYYKGVRLTDKDSSIYYLKKAELVSKDVNDCKLSSKIFESIAYLNLRAKEYQRALQYAFKNLQQNKIINRKNWLACAYNTIALVYSGLGKKDSAAYYIKQCLPLLRYVTDQKTQAVLLNNMCVYNKDLPSDSVQAYLEKSYQIDFNVAACTNLAAFYNLIGKKDKSDSLWIKSLEISNIEKKIAIIQAYIEQKEKEGEYENASKMSVRLLQLQDSLIYQLRNQQVGKIQTEFDQQTKLNEEKGYRKSLYGWIAFCVVLLIISTIYIRYRICKSRIVHQADQMQIKESKETIAALEAEGAQHQELLAEQQKVLLQHQENHSQSLDRGRLLYEQIRSGQNTSLWDKHDFQDFLNYYWSVDAAFISRLKSDYKNLTPRQQFFLILEHEGFGDEEIMRIFGICNSAMRSKRCRIRQQKKQAK